VNTDILRWTKSNIKILTIITSLNSFD